MEPENKKEASYFKPAKRKGGLGSQFTVHLNPEGLLWAFSGRGLK